MKLTLKLLGLATAGLIATTAAADATTLWRGTAWIVSSSGNALCTATYKTGGHLQVLYRPNLGTSANESAQLITDDGSLLIKSTDSADHTLRTGNISVSGAALAIGFSATATGINITILPAVASGGVKSTTENVLMAGIIKNAGIAGCNVNVKATLLPTKDGPL